MPPARFRELFEAHTDFVWRVLRRYGVPDRELEDACQEVFLVVFRRLPDFEERSSMRTWIYGIAARVALGLGRRAFMRRELLNGSTPEQSVPDGAFDAYAQSQERQLLHEALATLSEAQREAFVLYELEGMTMADVAAALGVPENTALYRVYGARKEISTFVRRLELRVVSKATTTASARVQLWGSAKKGAES